MASPGNLHCAILLSFPIRTADSDATRLDPPHFAPPRLTPSSSSSGIFEAMA